MRALRIISAERWQNLQAARDRIERQHTAVVADKQRLEAELRLAAQENARLLLENQALHDHRPPAPPPVQDAEGRAAGAAVLERRLAVMQRQLDAAMGYSPTTQSLLDLGRTAPRPGFTSSSKPAGWVIA